MGRYLRGTANFSYKYAFAEQTENLVELADAIGAGVGGLVPAFGGGYTNIEANFEVPVLPLLREIAKAGAARGGEIKGVITGTSDMLPSPTLEYVQYAIGENLVEVITRLDKRLEDIPLSIDLDGVAAFELARSEYPAALAYINERLPAKQRPKLADLRDEKRAEALFATLGDTEQYLPAMALWIVHHAVKHELKAISVRETQRSVYATDLWSLLRDWGPNIFGRTLPSSDEEWFTRAIVQLMSDDKADGRKAMATALACGYADALRWIEELDIAPDDIVTPPTPSEMTAGERIDAAFQRGDNDAIVAELVNTDGDFSNVDLGLAIASACDTNVEPLRPLWPAIEAWDRPPIPACWPVAAYNYACLASRLGDKPAMLRWMGITLVLGTDPKDFVGDTDFKPYLDDAEFRALVGRKRRGRQEIEGSKATYVTQPLIETTSTHHVFERTLDRKDGAWIYGLCNSNRFPIELRYAGQTVALAPWETHFEPDVLATPLVIRMHVAIADFPDVSQRLELGFYSRR